MQSRRKTPPKTQQQIGVTGSQREAVASLRAADAAWLKAYQAKDVSKAAEFYDKHGAMLLPNAPLLTGKSRITQFIAKSLTMPDYEISWHCNQAGVPRSGELGYTTGAYRMSFRDSSGKKFHDHGKYLMVWKKQKNGSWKVLFDMSNSDLPVRGRLD